MADYDYQRFGSGFVRRAKDSSDDWYSCARDDVPQDFFREEQRVQVRREVGGDPYFRPSIPPDGEYVGASGARIGAFRMANPDADAIASELGLTANELRARLTRSPGGTNRRVSEERFDAIAASLGIDPQLARDRFADRDQEKPSDADELRSR